MTHPTDEAPVPEAAASSAAPVDAPARDAEASRGRTDPDDAGEERERPGAHPSWLPRGPVDRAALADLPPAGSRAEEETEGEVVWVWWHRSTWKHVLITAIAALLVSALAALAAYLVMVLPTDSCEFKGELGCLPPLVMSVFGIPPFAGLFLWQILRIAKVLSPGIVAFATVAGLLLLAWVDQLGLPVLWPAIDAVPWWVGLPLVATALAAAVTRVVCSRGRND